VRIAAKEHGAIEAVELDQDFGRGRLGKAYDREDDWNQAKAGRPGDTHFARGSRSGILPQQSPGQFTAPIDMVARSFSRSSASNRRSPASM
jgi:hypothetical protein